MFTLNDLFAEKTITVSAQCSIKQGAKITDLLLLFLFIDDDIILKRNVCLRLREESQIKMQQMPEYRQNTQKPGESQRFSNKILKGQKRIHN